MLSEYNSMYGDTLIMHGVVHMEDDIHRKQNDLILKLYTTPMEDLLVTCCDGLRGIIPFDHSYTCLLYTSIARETKHYVYDGNLEEVDDTEIPQYDEK